MLRWNIEPKDLGTVERGGEVKRRVRSGMTAKRIDARGEDLGRHERENYCFSKANAM